MEQIKGRDVEKDEIKQNIGRSPDYADAMSMRGWFDVQPSAIEFAIGFF